MRLKIVEQIIIVLVLAVIFPLIIAAIVVLNVNQHAVRKELVSSADITATSVYQRLVKTIEEKKLAVSYVASSVNHIKSQSEVKKYLSEISANSKDISLIDVVDSNYIGTEKYIPAFIGTNTEIYYDKYTKELVIYAKISEQKYVREFIDIKKLENDIFKVTDSADSNNKRQIYVLDQDNKILMSHNYDSNYSENLVPVMQYNPTPGKPMIFGAAKNQPNVLIKLQDPEWKIVVITPKDATRYSIIKARYKIIIAIVVAALSIILLGAAYTFSLYTNIRQLFKAIRAISKGNYSRKIRLIKNIFTPFESIFLTNEFNKMAEKVDKAYKKIEQNNKKLSKMDEFKSNLIDTVSHEFRTPLTNIKGYTSRLLRNDINIDEETKVKSLKVIKQQTERLSRLVEDLLVIPELESFTLRVFPSEVNLKETVEHCILSVNQKNDKIINFSIEENLPDVYADPDRVQQIIINLLENAIKYSTENSDININIRQSNNFAIIKIQNECEYISKEKLNSLFGKFVRIDDKLTRTTRGTGLGLFIVKGLVETMGGKISLSNQNGFEVTFTLPFAGIGNNIEEAEENESFTN